MRMRRRSEFARTRAEGRTFGGRYLVLGVRRAAGDQREGEPEGFRFGIILTRKVGNAVVRNRVRRRVRSILSEFGERLELRGNLVIIARHTAPGADFEALRRDWKKLARRAGILSDNAGTPEP